MRDASICGLGQTAANAVQSAISSLGVFGGAPSTPSKATRCRPDRGTGDVHGRRAPRAAPAPDDDHGGRRRDPGARGSHDPRRLPCEPGRHADALLRRQPHPDQRVPRLRGRGRGLQDARALVQPTGRGRHGRDDGHRPRAALAHARDGAARVERRDGPDEPRCASVDARIRRASGTVRRGDAGTAGRGARRARARPPPRARGSPLSPKAWRSR